MFYETHCHEEGFDYDPSSYKSDTCSVENCCTKAGRVEGVLPKQDYDIENMEAQFMEDFMGATMLRLKGPESDADFEFQANRLKMIKKDTWGSRKSAWCEKCSSGSSSSLITTDKTKNTCLDPSAPDDSFCEECVNKAVADCKASAEQEGTFNADAQEKSIALCMAHLGCLEGEGWSDQICSTWKAENCNSAPTPAPAKLLDTRHNSSNAIMLRHGKTISKGLEAVVQRRKARQISSSAQRFGESNKLDSSMQGKCSG